jgi:release factor glutamine methyltransferase
VLKRSAAWLAERGIGSARLDAEILLAHGLGLKRLDLYLQYDRRLTPAERDRLRPLLRERAAGVPVAYLTGEREFWSLPFHLDRSVLVPRPETEHLVEVALAHVEGREAPVFADVGTGSGCIAVAVLHGAPRARAHALDCSPAALEVAARNAERHGVAGRLAFASGDLLEPLRPSADWGRLDAVVSNPPYVVRGDPSLAPDVAAHEPEVALYVPGPDALAVAQQIAEQAREALAPGGLLALEVGAGSAPEALRRLGALGYCDVRAVQDLAGIERVVLGLR